MKFGNWKQITTSAVLLLITILGLMYKPMTNIHLVFTFLFFGIMAYTAYQANEGIPIKNQFSLCYQITFVVITIISISAGWWIRAILWALVSIIYYGLKDKRKRKEPKVESKV